MRPLPMTISLMLMLPSLSIADEQSVRFAGYVKGFAFERLTSAWEFDRVGTRLQLTASGGDGDPASFYASVDFELDSRLFENGMQVKRGQGFDVYPVEMYLSLSFESMDIFIGQQFVFWGRTTWINPSDVLTAWDFSNMASEIEDYRLAPVGVRINWYITDDLKLDLVWVPVFRPNRVPGIPHETLGKMPVVEYSESLPEQKPQNSEVGLRLSQSVSSWAFDWAICAYKGFEKFPNIEISPVFSPGQQGYDLQGMKWKSSYSQMWMIGGDFSKAIGQALLTTEIAYKGTQDMAGHDPVIQNPRFEYVMGLSYSFTENLEIGLQYIGKFLVNYDRKTELAALEKLGYPKPFASGELDHQGSLFFKLKLSDDFGMQALGIYDMVYSDFFVLSFVWWRLADSVKTYLGAVAFGGKDDSTPFARQSSSSEVFLEIKVSY